MSVENKFCDYFECYGLTTGKDKHGDIWTKEQLIKIKNDFESHPESKIIFSQHKLNDQVGKILSMKIEERGDWAGLKVKVGVFNGKKEEFERMKKENWGLSVGVLYSSSSLSEEEIINSKIKVEVSPFIHKEAERILDSLSVKYGVYLRKAVDASTIISLIGLTLTEMGILFDLLLRLRDERNKEGKIIIIIDKDKKELTNKNKEEIAKAINKL